MCSLLGLFGLEIGEQRQGAAGKILQARDGRLAAKREMAAHMSGLQLDRRETLTISAAQKEIFCKLPTHPPRI